MSVSAWYRARDCDMEINKLSQRLLDEGYTEDQTPPCCKPWNQFYGGWTYKYQDRLNTVFETPCGLLLKRTEMGHSGLMSYMGIDWMEENDNATIICPYYDRTAPCGLNHPLLETQRNAGCHYEGMHFCAVHETDKPYSYEHSTRRVEDLADQEKNQLWQEFFERHKGRVCRAHCRYNRKTKVWTAGYYPERCKSYGCSFCTVLQVDIDVSKKGNIFYDEKRTRQIAGEGLFEDYEQITVIKGKRLLDKNIPLQKCEAIVKYGLREVKHNLRMKYHSELYFNHNLKIEFLNFRAEKRESRDILQDLEDVANGIAVVHEADQVKQKDQDKRQRRKEAYARKVAIAEKKIVQNGLDSLTGYQRERMEHVLGEDRCYELNEKYLEKKAEQQMSLFD